MPPETHDITSHRQGDTHIISNDELTGDIVDITGGEVQWLLFEEEADATGAETEDDAILTKSSDAATDFDGWDNEIEIIDASAGEFEVLIGPGDTENAVPEGNPEAINHHRCRVWDSTGKRVTVFQGDFTISS